MKINSVLHVIVGIIFALTMLFFMVIALLDHSFFWFYTRTPESHIPIKSLFASSCVFIQFSIIVTIIRFFKKDSLFVPVEIQANEVDGDELGYLKKLMHNITIQSILFVVGLISALATPFFFSLFFPLDYAIYAFVSFTIVLNLIRNHDARNSIKYRIAILSSCEHQRTT